MTKSGQDSSPRIIRVRDFFEIVTQLLDKGKMFRESDPRYVFPVKQLGIGDGYSVAKGEQKHVEVTFDRNDIITKSAVELSERTAEIKAMLDRNEIPEGVNLKWVDHRTVAQTHIIDTKRDHLYRYVSKDSRDRSKELLCMRVEEDMVWPTSSTHIAIAAGDYLTLRADQVRAIETKVRALHSVFAKNQDIDQNYAIRQDFFLAGGGDQPHTRVSFGHIPASEFPLYRPL